MKFSNLHLCAFNFFSWCTWRIMKINHQNYVNKGFSFFNYILQWKLIDQYTKWGVWLKNALTRALLFAFFYANKAKMSNFQKRAPLGKRARGGTSAPNDLPWYVPEALQLSDINLHKLKKKQQKNKKTKKRNCKLVFSPT